MKTLIIDDDKSARMIMAKMLGSVSECDFAENGDEGCSMFISEFVKGHPYDLVCLDINMPHTDGHQTLENIRRFEETRNVLYSSQVKVIMISSMNDPHNVVGAFKEGCEDYIVKPVDREKLYEVIVNLGLAIGVDD